MVSPLMARHLSRIYLAGPDVFLPDPVARGAVLKAICARHGLDGVYPLDPVVDDPAWADWPEARRISAKNVRHMLGCDAIAANLTPFRGPSADAGTVFELGFMAARGPAFGWSNVVEDFVTRTLAFLGPGARHDPGRGWVDAQGMAVEAFGCADNLMIDGALTALFRRATPEAARWDDLSAFEDAVAAAARALRPV